MLKDLINKQRLYTEFFFANIDIESIEKIVHFLKNSTGTIIFTGVGKSGLIAKKIALTIASIGIKALYLSAMDAVHGDLGIVFPGDTVLIFSKSGESDELIDLIPAIHNKGGTVISILCTSKSRIANASDHIVLLPFQHELCPFDMTPTMSTIFQMLFGDLLTVALMHEKFQVDQYMLNHPSGRIGKRMIVKVKDLMLTGSRIPLCTSQDLIKNILTELSGKRCGCILIQGEDQTLAGIFTDGDLGRLLQREGTKAIEFPIGEVMTRNFRFTTPDVLAWNAMKEMEMNKDKRITVLPVLTPKNKIIGLIHLHDIIAHGL